MQYVELDIVRAAAKNLADVEEAGQNIGCEALRPEVGLCGRPADYLIPNATLTSGGEQGVERRPVMFCREHLEELLGHPPDDQPFVPRVTG